MTRNLCWLSYLSCFEIPEDPISKQSQRWPEKLTSTPGQSLQLKVKLSVEVFFNLTQVYENKLFLFSSKNVKIWSKKCYNNSNNACKECQMSELSHAGIFLTKHCPSPLSVRGGISGWDCSSYLSCLQMSYFLLNCRWTNSASLLNKLLLTFFQRIFFCSQFSTF